MPEFTIVKTDLLQDYIDFIDALNYKFAFKNKDKFEDDFGILMGQIDPSGTYDADKVYGGFIDLIKKHSSIENLEDNVDFALAELKALGSINGN